MSKKTEKKKVIKAEDLIEEALRAVEQREAEAARGSDEVESKSGGSEGPSAVAKIDLQQYIEKEAYLRLAADFENFRKRSAKEKLDAERTGRERVLRGFLEILDNLERGLAQAKEEKGPLADGMRMILSQAEAWLRSEGLERVESVGKVFDPSVHDAISQMESSTVAAGFVTDEVKRGYTWGGRLLRPAAVVVSKGSAASDADSEQKEE